MLDRVHEAQIRQLHCEGHSRVGLLVPSAVCHGEETIADVFHH